MNDRLTTGLLIGNDKAQIYLSTYKKRKEKKANIAEDSVIGEDAEVGSRDAKDNS